MTDLPQGFIDELCTLSGDIARAYYRQPFEIDSKSDETPVTVADREIELRLRAFIEVHFPKDGIIGEEFGETPSRSGRTWILDPIDGTKSFTIGRPTFTTLIALCEEGVPVLGVIDQPIIGDRWVGARGQVSTHNGKPISVRSCPSLKQAICGVGGPDQVGRANHDMLRDASRYMIYQGDAYLYGLMAQGHMDLVVEATMGVYDIMALVPIVEGAGGIITDWQGKPQIVGSSDKVLAAGSVAIHQEAMVLLT
jgi:inositol-phosphate phosphatase/L-galactose 1-phosphate phosphatase/histidinol-phosphatase